MILKRVSASDGSMLLLLGGCFFACWALVELETEGMKVGSERRSRTRVKVVSVKE